jgi:tetratricopeptide (TPR) repeat protein
MREGENMKHRFFILTGLLLTLTSAVQADPAARFTAAGAAYDTGAYDQAIAGYQALRQEGYRDATLEYNLGNAAFRQGDYGRAILAYRRAAALAPRDAEIRHNLRYAVSAAGALEPDTPWLPALLGRATLTEWTGWTIAWWWITVGAAIVLLRRPGPTALRAVFYAATVFLLIGLAGLAVQWQARLHPAAVVVESGQQLLFAPLEGSTAHIALPQGSTARVESEKEGWYNLRVNDKQGWIKKSSVRRVR